jgi:hypothetical protein
LEQGLALAEQWENEDMTKIPSQGDFQGNGNIAGVVHEPILMQGLGTEDDRRSPTKGKIKCSKSSL